MSDHPVPGFHKRLNFERADPGGQRVPDFTGSGIPLQAGQGTVSTFCNGQNVFETGRKALFNTAGGYEVIFAGVITAGLLTGKVRVAGQIITGLCVITIKCVHTHQHLIKTRNDEILQAQVDQFRTVSGSDGASEQGGLWLSNAFDYSGTTQSDSPLFTAEQEGYSSNVVRFTGRLCRIRALKPGSQEYGCSGKL